MLRYSSLMQYFRRKRNLKMFPWLLAVAVLLRSFIAPGYMLSASDGSGLGIIFCDGPVYLAAPEDGHSVHHHVSGDHQVQKNIHISPLCSDWSTSSLLVFSKSFESVLLDTARFATNPDSQPLLYRRYFDNARLIRGPPVLA